MGTTDPFAFTSTDYMNYKLFSCIQLQAVCDDVKGLLLHTFIIFSESVHDTCVLEKMNLYQEAVYSPPDYFYCGGWSLLLHWPACYHHYLVLKAAAREVTESLLRCAKPHDESSGFIRPNKLNHVPLVITAYSAVLPDCRRCHRAHWKVEMITWSARAGGWTALCLWY